MATETEFVQSHQKSLFSSIGSFFHDEQCIEEDFFAWLKKKKQLSHISIKNYIVDLRSFLRTLDDIAIRYPDKARSSQLVAAIDEFFLEGQKSYTKATMKRRITTLYQFFSFIETHLKLYAESSLPSVIKKKWRELKRLWQHNEAYQPSDYKYLLQHPFHLSPEDINGFFNQLPRENFSQKRIRSILELTYSTGIRVCELAMLMQKDIELSHSYVHIRSHKKVWHRKVPLGTPCRNALKEYMHALPKQYLGPNHPLFFNRAGAFLTTRSIQRLVQGYLQKLALPFTLTLRDLRALCLHHLLLFGAQSIDVKKYFGFSALKTLDPYIKNLDRALDQNPKSLK